MTPTEFEDQFLLRILENRRRYVFGYGDVTGETSWHAVPGRPVDRLKLLMGNLLYVTLGQMNPQWSATLDYDRRGDPSAVILTSKQQPASVIELKLSKELLRLTTPDGRARCFVLKEGGTPIVVALAEICAEYFLIPSSGGGATETA